MLETVAEVMTREVATVTPETSYREAVRLIEERNVHALPVVSTDGRLVGIVSEQDLMHKEELFAEPDRHRLLPSARREARQARALTVRELMSERVHTVRPGSTLGEAARELHRRRIGRLPVVDESGRLAGIVTRSDLLRVFLRPDAELEADVREAVQRIGRHVAPGVDIGVAEGRVRLSGRVERRSQALAVEDATRRVAGVCAVECHLHADLDDVAVAMVGP